MYTITNILADGDRVALEMDWIGITAVQIQNLTPNSEMRDHAAVFLHFREGRIARQRHYDCFEPWWAGLRYGGRVGCEILHCA
jgi:ketosteroid isomerase-like protein